MLRNGVRSVYQFPLRVGLVLWRPVLWEKVGIKPASNTSGRQRNNPLMIKDAHGKKHFHVNISRFSLSDNEIKSHMDGITDKFTEAMELLSDAVSSKGTVYFSEDMTDAEALIDEVLRDYQQLLRLLSDDQARNVVRSIGLKMEELRAQLQMLKESVKE